MKIKKVSSGMRGVVAYEVDDPADTEYIYTVFVFDGKPVCGPHGDKCAHAQAVAEKLAKKP